MNLKNKLLSLFGATSFVTVLLVAVVLQGYLGNELKNLVGNNQLELTEYTMQSIERLLYERVLDMRGIRDEISELISKESGQITKGELVNRLEELRNVSGPWIELSVVDNSGDILASTNEKVMEKGFVFERDEPLANRAYLEVLESGKEYQSDVEKTSLGNRPTMIFADVVRDSRGVITHVVIGHYAWYSIIEMMQGLGEISLHLYNKEGLVIGANNPDHIKGVLLESHADREIVQHALNEEPMFMESRGVHNLDEKQLITHVVGIGYQDYETQGWGLVGEQPLSRAYASINRSVYGVLGFLTLFLILSAYRLASFVVNKMIRPIESIAEASKEISKGNFSRKIVVSGKDEISVLGRNFNTMAKKLEDSVKNLESQVEEKTKTLREKMNELQTKSHDQEMTQKAMINLLEDAKELEEELVKQKEGVEKQVEERTKQLKNEKARLNASINALPHGLLILDTKHNIIEYNAEIKRLMGIEEEGVVDINTFTEFLGKLGYKIEDTCAHCRNEKFIEDDVDYGAMHLKLLSLKVSTETEVIGTIYLIEDITEAKTLQKTRDEFFSVASHELRTPLTAIRGNTQMLQDYYPELQENEEVKTMLTDIHSASIRLIQIVNDFLDASRLELKKMDMKFEVFSLNEILDRVMRDVTPKSVGKQLEYKLEAEEGDDFKVSGDKARLEQVIINIVGNALKFTNEGGVYLKAGRTNHGNVKLEITDTGQGISEEDQSELFQKFKQVGSNAGLARDVSQGTGMGLYISKLIMQTMGGRIYLKSSKKGEGSTFVIEVPEYKGEEVDNRQNQQK